MTEEKESRDQIKRVQFEVTALPFLRPLYRTALRLSRSPEDAPDLVQETLLRAYRTFENFVPGTNCKAWLFRILYSILANQYQKAKRVPQPVPFDERFHQLVETRTFEADLRRLGDVEWESAEVALAVARLPESFRAALLLVDVEEFTYQESAEILQCPVGTLRSRLFRARKMLFTALHDYARERGYIPASSED